MKGVRRQGNIILVPRTSVPSHRIYTTVVKKLMSVMLTYFNPLDLLGYIIVRNCNNTQKHAEVKKFLEDEGKFIMEKYMVYRRRDMVSHE